LQKLLCGEPLVRKGVVNFIEKLALFPDLKDLSLTTNGVLLKEYARDLKKAGLTRINISLDTLNRETFKKITRFDLFPFVMDGIFAALETGFSPVKINTVLTENIYHELDSFIDFLKTYPVDIRFIELMPFGNSIRKYISASDFFRNLKDKLNNLTEVEYKRGNGPARYFSAPLLKGKIGIISPYMNHFCINCNRLRLTADGKLRVCLFSDKEINVKSALRNFKNKNLDDIINIIRKAVLLKPESYRTYSRSKKSMYKIGG